ncbi:MAG: biotin--[acetyl-CoA-carboxylase] ligase [Lentisphaerae bacterium]|nr:biotin--[acetyl-CoA-carboxylase] ligase [Lentisphaerota bacterium]
MKNEPHTVAAPGQGLWGGRLLTFESLPSTNQWALDHAADARHGDIIRAVQQTAGRGRFNRQWLSPGGRELTLSVCLHLPGATGQTMGWLGPAVALAIHTAVATHGITAKVKWPNDVLVGRRKLAGILCERDLRTSMVVVGMGLNVNLKPDAMNHLAAPQPVTSMHMETGRELEPELVLQALRAALERFLPLAMGGACAGLQQAWAEHDGLSGQRVRLTTTSGEVEGDYAGLTPEGYLRLRVAAGTERVFLSGDVTLAAPRDVPTPE